MKLLYTLSIALCGALTTFAIWQHNASTSVAEQAATAFAAAPGYSVYDDTDAKLIGSGDTVVVKNTSDKPIDVTIIGASSGNKATKTVAAASVAQIEISEDAHVRIDEGVQVDEVDAICCIDCFPGSIAVATVDGLRTISELAPGDQLVNAIDGTPIELRAVVRSRSLSLHRITTAKGTLESSRGHRMQLLGGSWVGAATITPGLKVATIDGGHEVVLDAFSRELSDSTPVYNLVTDGGMPIAVGPSGIVAATIDSASMDD